MRAVALSIRFTKPVWIRQTRTGAPLLYHSPEGCCWTNSSPLHENFLSTGIWLLKSTSLCQNTQRITGNLPGPMKSGPDQTLQENCLWSNLLLSSGSSVSVTGSHCVRQASLELMEIHLPLASASREPRASTTKPRPDTRVSRGRAASSPTCSPASQTPCGVEGPAL